MSVSKITLSRADAEDFARCTLSEVATRAPSKHQEAPFVAPHMARHTGPKYLRGSDLSERLFVSSEVLRAAGLTQNEALMTITPLAEKFLGKTKRGRPRAGSTKPDFFSAAESVRSMVNAFAKRKRYPVDIVDRWVGKFMWEREIGVICGSEFDPRASQRIYQTRLQFLRNLRRLGAFRHTKVDT